TPRLTPHSPCSSGVRPLPSHPTAPVAQGLDPSPHTFLFDCVCLRSLFLPLFPSLSPPLSPSHSPSLSPPPPPGSVSVSPTVGRCVSANLSPQLTVLLARERNLIAEASVQHNRTPKPLPLNNEVLTVLAKEQVKTAARLGLTHTHTHTHTVTTLIHTHKTHNRCI
uniref:Uncharacterized protein n=1 Tax=Callorhinchus milii TaxID=7868 RepID=A0A4W3GMT8_CALMI